MAEELQTFHEQGTWSVVKILKGKKTMGSRWVYKTKFNSDGTVRDTRLVWWLMTLLKHMKLIKKKILHQLLK